MQLDCCFCRIFTILLIQVNSQSLLKLLESTLLLVEHLAPNWAPPLTAIAKTTTTTTPVVVTVSG